MPNLPPTPTSSRPSSASLPPYRRAGGILDIGCGPGHHTAALAQAGFAVTGVDYAPAMLDRARAKHPGVTFVEANLDHPAGLPVGPFDGVLCVSVIHVIAVPAALLGRVRDALGPGGHLLVEVASRPGRLSPGTNLTGRDRCINELKRTLARFPGAVRQYSPEELAGLVESCGFAVVGAPTSGVTVGVLARRS